MPALLLVSVVAAALLGGHARTYAYAAHGPFSTGTAKCLLCHDLHEAQGSERLFRAAGEKELCYSCHDGSGSVHDTRAAFGESTLGTTTMASAHPVISGAMGCRDCHSPHADPAVSPRILSSAGTTGGVAFCATCHGTGASLPGGDMAGGFLGTGHASLDETPSAAGIACLGCHQEHASPRSDLLRERVVHPDGTTRVAGEGKALCLTCHDVRSGDFPGAETASASKHATVLVSGRAATSYPGSGAAPGECANCHEPHGKTGNDAYLRDPESTLCPECHDAVGATYPAGYSYRGGAPMSSSGHTGVNARMGYATLASDSEGFAAWESVTEPTPSDPGTPIVAARLEGMRHVDSSRTVTHLADSDGAYDYQMYRFLVEEPAEELTAFGLVWRGYGEIIAGNPVSVSAWDFTSGTWEQLVSRQMANPETLRVALATSRHRDANGNVYVMAAARNAEDARVTSGPTMTRLSDSSFRVTWTTAGPCDTWLDYGPSGQPYGTTLGSGAFSTSHSVTVSGLAAGTYHYRVRSASRDGDEYVSADVPIGLPGPVLTPVPDQQVTGPVTVNFQWTCPSEAGRPFQYRVQVLNWYGTEVWSTMVNDATSAVTTLDIGDYRWRVEAIDSGGVSYGWSNEDAFSLWDPSGSCPFLFTGIEGGGFAFEADLYGAGKLATKTKSGYLKPEPHDYYVLRHEPEKRDGRYELRLVEERVEIDYLDEFKLFAIDAPAGVVPMTEKPQAGGSATGALDDVIHTVSAARAPLSAVHVQTAEDVAAKIAADDDDCVVLNEDRNVGFDYQTLELDLGSIAGAPQVKIAMDAVSMFPDSPEGTARSATFGPRTKLEVQDAAGQWVAVPASAGSLPKAPEFSRPYVFDISDIWVSDSRKVRFTFLFKTYVDWVAVDTSADVPVSVTEVPLAAADLRVHGFDPKSSADERYEYVYGEANDRASYPPGAYTRLGDVKELLGETDDRFVIYGGGDEIVLSFESPAPPAAGTGRTFVAYSNGYYKDNKVDVPHTVEPLPFAAMSNFPYSADEHYPDDAEHTAYLAEWNTRVVGSAVETSASASALTASAGLLERMRTFVGGVWRRLVALVTPGRSVGRASASAEEPDADAYRSLNTDYVGLELGFVASAGQGSCLACHAVHGQEAGGMPLPGATWAASWRMCTADGTGCHAVAANSASGISIAERFTASSSRTAHHDVRPADQDASGARIECQSCHNPHADGARTQVSDPDDPSSAVMSSFERFLDENGDLYVLIGAEHDAVPPVIAGASVDGTVDWQAPVVRWTTDEAATTRVDWGLSTDYEGGTVGNDSLVTSHAVSFPAATHGATYHYRIRTADALGNERISGDYVYYAYAPPPTPVPNPVPDDAFDDWLGVAYDFTWSAVTCPDSDPVEYEFVLDGVSYGWQSEATRTVTVYGGTHSWKVRSRDAVHTTAVSAFSALDVFTVTDNSGSCPFLFVWDGDEMAFEADLNTTGMLGAKNASGYSRPDPRDRYVLRSEPVVRDGTFDLRFVEERHEIDYTDEIKLYAVDLPEGVDLYAEKGERGKLTPLPPGGLHTVSNLRTPLSVVRTDTGDDVTAAIADDDGTYVQLNEDANVDFEYKTLELDLGDVSGAEQVKIVMDAESQRPSTPEGLARQRTFSPYQYMEVQDTSGEWRSVPASEATLPNAMEFARSYVFEIGPAMHDTTGKVRFTFLFKTYIDKIGFDTSADLPVVIEEVPLTSAELSYHGLDQHSNPGEVYTFLYGVPGGTHPFPPGAYTKYGDVTPLLAGTDDKFVIWASGDQLALRFAPIAPPAEGLRREYVTFIDGYYKSRKSAVELAVEPLPFAAMSVYPYPADEQYPDDPEHTAYVAEWNTRVVEPAAETSAAASGQPGSPGLFERVRSLVGGVWRRLVALVTNEAGAVRVAGSSGGNWARRHAVGVSVAAAGEHYSVNTDRVAVSGSRTDTSSLVTAPVQGWSSEGSATPPTPAAPGVEVTSGVLAAAAGADGDYWRTDEATADRRWNWQIARFRLSDAEIGSVNDLRVQWRGHGEPTSGYSTRIAVWDAQAGAWVWLHARDGLGADADLAYLEPGVPDSFCLSCHDGTAPADVVVPAGLKNVSAGWGSSAGADFHGARAGTNHAWSTGTIKSPYARGMAAVSCTACHDPHGSGSVYHVRGSVNDRTGISVVNGAQMKDLCFACHGGTVDDWHRACRDCHDGYWGHGDGWIDSPETSTEVGYPNANSDCSLCHNHGSKSNVGSDNGRGVDEREQAPSWCDHVCHEWDTTF